MKQIATLLLTLILPLITFAQPENEYYDNNSLKRTGKFLRGEPDGLWKQWTDQGKLESEILYSEGKVLNEKRYVNGGLYYEADYSTYAPLIFIRNFQSNQPYAFKETFQQSKWSSENWFAQTCLFNPETGEPTTLCYYEQNNSLRGIRFSFGKNKQVLSTGYYRSNYNEGQKLSFHPNGVLSEFHRCSTDPDSVRWARFNDKGERIGNMLQVLPNWQNASHYPFKNRLTSQWDGNLPTGEWKNYYENGQLWYIIRFSKGKFEGNYEVYFFNGKKAEEGSYHNGLLHGHYKLYHENGTILEEGNYKNGYREGEWVFRNEKGMMTKTESWNNQKKSGAWRTWHANGNLSTETFYWNNLYIGHKREWYESGILKTDSNCDTSQYASGFTYSWDPAGKPQAITAHQLGLSMEWRQNKLSSIHLHTGNYSSNKGLTAYWNNGLLTGYSYIYEKGLHGTQRNFDLNGVVTSESRFLYGKKTEKKNISIPNDLFADNPTELFIQKGDSLNGKRNGKWTTYYREGVKWIEEYYVDGKHEGSFKAWTPAGKLYIDAAYKNDLADGPYHLYLDNGKLWTEGEFSRGKKTGKWMEYDTSGAKKNQTVYVPSNEKVLFYEYYNTKTGLPTQNTSYESNGRRQTQRHFYENGQLKSELQVLGSDTMDGPYRTYYENGQLQSQGQYYHKHLNGFCTSWNQDGTINWTREYLYGTIVSDNTPTTATAPVVSKLGFACQCQSDYTDRMKIGFAQGLDYWATARQVNALGIIHIDSVRYDRLFFFHSDVQSMHPGSSYYNLEIVAFDTLRFELNRMRGIDVVVNPCLDNMTQASKIQSTTYKSQPIKNRVYDFDGTKFDHSPKAYYKLALETFDYETEEMLRNLFDYNESVEKKTDRQLLKQLHRSKIAVKVKMANRDSLISGLLKYVDEEGDEALIRFVYSQFIRENSLRFDKKSFDRKMAALFGITSNSIVDELDESMRMTIDFKLETDHAAFDFPLELLQQWNPKLNIPMQHNKGPVMARAVFSIDQLEWRTGNEISFVNMKNPCFSPAVITGTSWLIKSATPVLIQGETDPGNPVSGSDSLTAAFNNFAKLDHTFYGLGLEAASLKQTGNATHASVQLSALYVNGHRLAGYARIPADKMNSITARQLFTVKEFTAVQIFSYKNETIVFFRKDI